VLRELRSADTGTAVIGHHYWTLTDPERSMNVTQFYKNMSIIGGFLLLSVTGAGKYSLDRKLGGTRSIKRS
jgi:putative oxidoreductase